MPSYYHENNKSLTFCGVTDLLTRKQRRKRDFRPSLSPVWRGIFTIQNVIMTHAWEGKEGNRHYLKGGGYFHPLLTHYLIYDVLAIYGLKVRCIVLCYVDIFGVKESPAIEPLEILGGGGWGRGAAPGIWIGGREEGLDWVT